MTNQSYIGIDCTDNNEWIAVFWVADKIILSRPFKNTTAELGTLAHFITEQCTKPKICLRLTNPSTFNLIKFIGSIPDVEVMLMSNAGFRLYQAWLPKENLASFTKKNAYQAYLLACCAERMA